MKARAAGFTLIELVIVIAVIGAISAVFVQYLTEGTRMYSAVESRKEMTMEGRQALLRMTREVRQIRSKGDVVAATPTQFSFYGVNDSLYTLSFSGVPGAPLLMTRGAVSVAIATGVDSLAFEYRKSDGTLAAPLVMPSDTDIYRVGIFVRLASGATRVSMRGGTFARNVR